MRHIYKATEISELFGKRADWFTRNRDSLIAAGFPEPLPGVGHKRWSRPVVDNWFAQNGKPALPRHAANDDEADVTLELEIRALEIEGAGEGSAAA